MSILLTCAITHQSHVQGTVLKPCPRLNVQLNQSTHPNHDSHSFFSAIVYSDDYLSHDAFVVFVVLENAPLLPPLLATLKRMKLPPRKKRKGRPRGAAQTVIGLPKKRKRDGPVKFLTKLPTERELGG